MEWRGKGGGFEEKGPCGYSQKMEPQNSRAHTCAPCWLQRCGADWYGVTEGNQKGHLEEKAGPGVDGAAPGALGLLGAGSGGTM